MSVAGPALAYRLGRAGFSPTVVEIAPALRDGGYALVRDAACGAALGGMGTGTAIVAAYVLAGELAADGDQHIAFARYAQRVRRYAKRCRQGGDRTGTFLAPRSRVAMRLRNRLLGSRILLKAMLQQGQKVTSVIDLPNYDA